MGPSDAEPRQRYYTPKEVAAHNCEEDIWVSFLGRVVDLTETVRQNSGSPLLSVLLASAGQDISHWFDSSTGEPRQHVDAVTGLKLPYSPHGRYLHIPPAAPRSDWATDFGCPWWKDDRLLVGKLSSNVRAINVTNMLSRQTQLMEVCGEETLDEIQRRYQYYNSHTKSYTWKYLGKVLEMDKTLEQNGIPDQGSEMLDLGIDDTAYVPEIQVYYNDDLTDP